MRQLTLILFTVATLACFAQDKAATSADTIILVTEPMPEYPGGHAEMVKFIKKNLKQTKLSKSVSGKVYIEFVVKEDGSLTEHRIVRGINDSLNSYALQVVKKMPKWIPAKLDNKPIQKKIILPIPFE